MTVHGGQEGLPADGRVVIVGAGLAGLRAAQALREEGFKGTVAMVGAELHPPYDRPPLSKQVLSGKWTPESAVLADAEKLDELHVDHAGGRQAVALDAERRSVTLEDGAVLEADGIVLATGARARSLPGVEPLEGLFLLRTLDDALALRATLLAHGEGARVVVVGGGFIGSEVAATCAGLGCTVTVLEALHTPLLGALGPAVGAACGALHARHGVELRTGVSVHSVRARGAGQDAKAGQGAQAGRGASAGRGGLEISLSRGAPIVADVVVVGIGVVPNTEWLVGSGLEVDNGVVCDRALFAADGIVAAGDVSRWAWRHLDVEAPVRIEHWEVASQAGGAAAHSLLAGRRDAPAFAPVPYFWSDQYGLRIQVLGHPLPGDDLAVVHGALDADDGRFVAIYGRSGRLSGAVAVSRPRQLMAFQPLIASGASFQEALELLPT